MRVLVDGQNHHRAANSFPQWGAPGNGDGGTKPGVNPNPQPIRQEPQETFQRSEPTTRGEAAWSGFKKGALWTTAVVGTLATVGMIAEGNVDATAIGELVAGTLTCGGIGGGVGAAIKAVMHKG